MERYQFNYKDDHGATYQLNIDRKSIDYKIAIKNLKKQIKRTWFRTTLTEKAKNSEYIPGNRVPGDLFNYYI